MNPTKKTVLCFSGFDPTGGAGIQADIEAIAANGAYACTIPTCLTAQNTQVFKAIQSIDAADIKIQLTTLLDDIKPDAIKIGLIGHTDNIEIIHQTIQKYPEIPVVLDPVLKSGNNALLSSQNVCNGMLEKLIPYVDIITPNIPEAQQLAGKTNLKDCAENLLQSNCKAVLITGTHADSKIITHHLHTKSEYHIFNTPRLEGIFHGSGCTLSASISALLAQGYSISEAVEKALDYTYQTLLHALPLGKSQLCPNRFPDL